MAEFWASWTPPYEGGGPPLPPFGRGFDVDDSVLCVGGGYGGGSLAGSFNRSFVTSLYWWGVGGDVSVCRGMVAW
jgi:hypothetical protein